MNFFVLFLSLLSLVWAAPLQELDVTPRDVYVPKIISPDATTVWQRSHVHTVTWNTTDHPVNITNKIGQIYLRKAGHTLPGGPLAKGFDILNGRAHVYINGSITPGSDYSIVLFGDSGNVSPDFTICA